MGEAIVKTSAQVDEEEITSSLTRTQSCVWTLPLPRVWLIHLQIHTVEQPSETEESARIYINPYHVLTRRLSFNDCSVPESVSSPALTHRCLISCVSSPCVIHFVPLCSSTGKYNKISWNQSMIWIRRGKQWVTGALHVLSFIFTIKSGEMCGRGV